MKTNKQKTLTLLLRMRQCLIKRRWIMRQCWR